jgi:hypothetical protein
MPRRVHVARALALALALLPMAMAQGPPMTVDLPPLER